MTLPSFVFGALLATLYGSLFHLWKGGSLLRLLADLIFAWLGFWGGHALAAAQGWSWGMIGSLHFLIATLTSLAALLAGHLLLPSTSNTDSSH